MVSMPVGRCSKDSPASSTTCSTFRPKPFSLFIMAFSTLMTEKPLRPATPVMVGTEPLTGASRLMIVPGCSGLLVLRMLVGMPAA